MRRLQLWLGILVFGGLVLGNGGLRAQTTHETVTETTPNTTGIVSDLTSGALIVKSDRDPSPLSYSYSKTTTYVDEAGNPVAIETVRSGVPVTVYYTKSPDGFVASKVVVHQHVEPSGKTTTIEERRTTTVEP